MFILIATLLVGGAFIYAEKRNKEAKSVYDSMSQQQGNLIAINDEINKPQELDTDGDGSMDWEEILVGTDPNSAKSKPSTDKTQITADLTKSTSTEKLSPIDAVSRDFFARYMELRQIGAQNNKESQEELARTTAGNIVISKPAEYKLSEIKTRPDSGNEGVKQYGQEVSNIFKKYSVKSRSEGVIAKEAGEKEDPEILKELDPIIESYKNILNALIKVKAPQSMATMHLDLLNAANGALFIAKSFRNSDVNPVESIQAIAYYQVVGMNLYNSINAIKSYYKYLGIYDDIF